MWPLLLDQCCDPAFLVLPGAPWGACRGCPIWPTETILPSPAVTRRPPGAKFLYRDAQLLRRSLSLRVILAILIVASGRIRKYCPASIRRRPPRHSVRQLEFRERAPPAVRAHIHSRSEFPLSPGRCLDGGRQGVTPPRPGGRGRVVRPTGTVRFVERRHRLVDAEIRGVSHHCRIVTYHNAPKTVVKVTRSSLLSVTGQYGAHRTSSRHPASHRPGPGQAIRLVPILARRGAGTR